MTGHQWYIWPARVIFIGPFVLYFLALIGETLSGVYEDAVHKRVVAELKRIKDQS